jgi:hypothetical protein
MPNATETAVKAAKAKAALAKVLRQKNNENAAGFFTVGIVGMIILFMIFHCIRYVFNNCKSKKGNPTALRVPFTIARYLSFFTLNKLRLMNVRSTRSLLIRKVPGFTSAGHALIFVGWFAICTSTAFVNIDWSTLNGWAKRLGW